MVVFLILGMIGIGISLREALIKQIRTSLQESFDLAENSDEEREDSERINRSRQRTEKSESSENSETSLESDDGSSLESSVESSKPESSESSEAESSKPESSESSEAESSKPESSESSEAESSQESQMVEEKPAGPNLGTAGSIGGRTVLVAIFVNEPRWGWDFEDATDLQTYSNVYYQLQTACEWIEDQTASYGVSSEFIWDWYNNDGLYFVANFEDALDDTMGERYSDIYDWMVSHIDADKILSQYEADNIIYMWYVDTDPYQTEHAFTFQFDFNGLTDTQVGYEGVWFNLHHDGFTLGAPTIAHELLHLYYENVHISQEYIDYLASIGSTDIMYMIYDDPFHINEQFTELDAYYVGLTEYSYDVEYFGLGPSSHFQ